MENQTPEAQIARFIYETGQLKRVARSGWWAAGVKNPESVAEHSFRAAVIAWFLAGLEGAQPEKAMAMALFHDVPEARTNDLHKVAQKYLDTKPAHHAIAQELSQSLPSPWGALFAGILKETEEQPSPEARVARDADLLECLFQAREYEALGYPVAEWIKNTSANLSTRSARLIAEAALKQQPYAWWRETPDPAA